MNVRFRRPDRLDRVGYFNPGERASLPDDLARRLCVAGVVEEITSAEPPPEETPPVMRTALDRPPAHKMTTRAPKSKGGRRHAQ